MRCWYDDHAHYTFPFLATKSASIQGYTILKKKHAVVSVLYIKKKLQKIYAYFFINFMRELLEMNFGHKFDTLVLFSFVRLMKFTRDVGCCTACITSFHLALHQCLCSVTYTPTLLVP